MNAIRVHAFGGPEVLRIESVPDLTPTPGSVLVRVAAAGVNPVDTYIRAGAYGPREFPFTPGYDAAGTVIAAGDGVALHPGQRVYVTRPPSGANPGTFTGTYAEQLLADASGVFPLPQGVSLAQGAGVGVPFGTAWRALFQRARARPGQTVLVHGASGGVGLAAVQIARAAGLRVIGTAGTPEGLDLVRAEGAHLACSHRDPAAAAAAAQILAETSGRGPDLILEMLANFNLQRDLEILAPGGTIVVIGNRGTLDFNPRAIMGKDANILGMALLNASQADFAELHAAIGAGLAAGIYRPRVALELPLARAPEAHERVLQPAIHGKIVLLP